MKSTLKKDIKVKVANALTDVLQKLEVVKPSKKTKRAIENLSKRLKRDVRKQAGKTLRKAKPSKNGKAVAAKAAEFAH